jgi:type IV pilus assembly protein PilB
MKRRPPKKVGEILIEKGLVTLEELAKGLSEQKRIGASLGSSLVRLGFIDYKQLEEVLSGELEKVQDKKIGEVLVEMNMITEAQLSHALELQRTSGKFAGEILVEEKAITKEQLFDVLSTQFDIKTVEADDFLFKKDIVDLLPKADALRLKAIPLRKVGKQLIVAMTEPFNYQIIREISSIVKLPVEPAYVNTKKLEKAIKREYAEKGDLSVLQRGNITETEDKAKTDDVKKVVDLILGQAIAEGAGFIHLEPNRSGLVVRFRIDGKLQTQSPVPAELTEDIIKILKEMARLKVEEQRTIQSGYFIYTHEGSETNFKISTFPVLIGYNTYCEKVTMKLLSREGRLEKLEDLGFYLAVQEKYIELLKSNSGVIIITGTVDSGVTSTLYASLRKIQHENLNIGTIERSIDTFIEGIAQTQIDLSRAYTFKEGLNSVVLDDADVLMVSELEDSDTANLVFQVALNGRLILTSLHSPESTSVYKILQDIGIDSITLAAGIKGVLAQRLVRRICGNCRESYQPAGELLENLRLRPRTPFFRGRGCQACNFSGFQGRVGIFELFIPDKTLRNSIATGLSANDIRRTAISNGMHTLRMDGLKKVLEGIATVEQVLGVSTKD